MKVGDYIHWVAERMMSSWDTYGIIKNIDTTTDYYQCTVFTIDDMKETTVSLNTILEEATIVSKDDYVLNIKKAILNKRKQLLDIEAQKEMVETQIEKLQKQI